MDTISTEDTDELGKINRLILIDGANFMHGVKKVKSPTVDIDERPNALPLALFATDMVKLGFRVRVCLLRNYTEINVNNYYALMMLRNAKLAIEPKINGKEMDDYCLLDIANKYGAVIVSNDNYHNFKHEMYVPVERIVKFEAIKPNCSEAELLKRPTYACHFILPSHDVYYAYPGDKHYRKVIRSYTRFSEPDQYNWDYINSFCDYIKDRHYLSISMQLPKKHFIKSTNQFPPSFGGYYQRWMENKYNENYENIHARKENYRRIHQK